MPRVGNKLCMGGVCAEDSCQRSKAVHRYVLYVYTKHDIVIFQTFIVVGFYDS